MKKIFMVLGIFFFFSIISVFSVTTSLKMIVGYKEFFSEKSPIIFNGQALLPLRNLAEEMGYKVSWEKNDKSIILQRNNMIYPINSSPGKVFKAKDLFIELKIDEKYIKKNNQKIKLSSTPYLIDNSTYVSFPFIEEVFDWDIFYSAVGWDNKPTVWITPFKMLVEDDFNLDIKNFELTDAEGDVEYSLKKTGTTWRGIKLGDSVEKLIEVYGIPFAVEEGKNKENLYYKYTSAFIPESEAFIMYVFELNDDTVKNLKIWLN